MSDFVMSDLDVYPYYRNRFQDKGLHLKKDYQKLNAYICRRLKTELFSPKAGNL